MVANSAHRIHMHIPFVLIQGIALCLPQPHTGHPGQPIRLDGDLSPVSVAITTLTRNKLPASARKTGIPGTLPGRGASRAVGRRELLIRGLCPFLLSAVKCP